MNAARGQPEAYPRGAWPADTALPRRLRAELQHGFTLLEVLIALVVLSLGLLGLAALQATTVQLNHSAYLRSQATNLAYDMADRMRTNRHAALEDNAYGNVDESDTRPACNPTLNATGNIPARDIAEWRNSLACALPQGHGWIERDGTRFTIGVQWDDNRDPDNPEVFEVTTAL